MLETISHNIRALGAVLGQTIANDTDQRWLDNIEHVRLLAKDGVANKDYAIEELKSLFDSCDEKKLLIYARAFSQFLNLANVAEQQHTISEQGLAELDLPHPLESLKDTLGDIEQDKEMMSTIYQQGSIEVEVVRDGASFFVNYPLN